MRSRELEIIGSFVDGLSEREAKEQLLLAYQMMEVCVMVLKGYDAVQPVVMRDNGLSSDLELYYACKSMVDGHVNEAN